MIMDISHGCGGHLLKLRGHQQFRIGVGLLMFVQVSSSIVVSSMEGRGSVPAEIADLRVS